MKIIGPQLSALGLQCHSFCGLMPSLIIYFLRRGECPEDKEV